MTNERNQKRVIGYCRVSTKQQDLQRQKKQCKDYCDRNGYKLVRVIDCKISGATSAEDNEAKQEMLSLTSEQCDIVVMTEVSRFTREHDEFYRIVDNIKCLNKQGVDVVFLDNPSKVFSGREKWDAMDFIFLILKAQGAAEELEKIKIRTTDGKGTKAANFPLMVIGSLVPFGYDKIDNPEYIKSTTPKSILAENEKQANAIRTAYEMIINGSSCKDVANFFNADEELHHKVKKRKVWHTDKYEYASRLWLDREINVLLKKPLYKGERNVMGTIHHIKPIVSADVWQRANDAIKGNRCCTKKKDHFNPLKGLIFCKDCGLPISLAHANKKPVYNCLFTNYKKRYINTPYKDKCNNCQIGFDWLLLIIKTLTKATRDVDVKVQKSILNAKQLKQQIDDLRVSQEAKRKESRDLTNDLNDLIKEQVKQRNSKIVYNLISKQIKAQSGDIEELDKEIGDIERNIEKISLMMESIQKEIGDIDTMTIEELEKVYNNVIERIEWDGIKNKRKGTLYVKYKNGISWKIENCQTFHNDKSARKLRVIGKRALKMFKTKYNEITIDFDIRNNDSFVKATYSELNNIFLTNMQGKVEETL